jgi:hypothetical protein
MNDESTANQVNVDAIAKELTGGRLSRRGLVERLKGVGLGFGAVLALGVAGAQAATAPDAAVTVKSANPAINSIIQQAPQAPVAGATTTQQVAWYHRFFRRYFTRYYNRY